MNLTIVEKNLLSWTAMHIDFVMCKKGRIVPKKTQRGDPIVSSGFVSYDKNGVTERGTLCTILNALPICRSSSLVL